MLVAETREMIDLDKLMAKTDADSPEHDREAKKLEDLFRAGIKTNEETVKKIRECVEQLKVLSAMLKASANEQEPSLSGLPRSSSASGPRSAVRASTSGGRTAKDDKEKDKEKGKDGYELDSVGGSPMPSPMKAKNLGAGAATTSGPGGPGRAQNAVGLGGGLGGNGGGSSSSVTGPGSDGNRDSMPPPSDTPAKGDSVPPEAPGTSTAAQRARAVFVKGQDVVFRPKPSAKNESPDWVLGRVQQVLDKGKTRQYKVQDVDPDLPPEQRSEFRINATNMIPIPAEGTELPPLDVGKKVLAEYPDSTTFYKAEVMGADEEGRVRLRFAGEENSDTLQLVERRKVVEFRS